MESTSPPPLLRLPMEIRMIICQFFLPLATRPNRWSSGSYHGTFVLSREYANAQPRLSCLGRVPRPSAKQLGILSLRAVNHQMYGEINTLIKVNPVNLRITDNMIFRNCSDKTVLDMLRYTWMTDNVCHIEIHIAHNGFRFTYPLSRGIQRDGMPDHKSRFGNLWSRSWEYLFGQSSDLRQPSSLEAFAAVLGTFRRLETVDLMTDHDMLFDVWSDPVGDSNAFLPLLKRGVVIEFKFPPFYDPGKMSQYRAAFDAMFRHKQSSAVWVKKAAFRWVNTSPNDRRLEAVDNSDATL